MTWRVAVARHRRAAALQTAVLCLRSPAAAFVRAFSRPGSHPLAAGFMQAM